jgi:Alkylmercury lyase
VDSEEVRVAVYRSFAETGRAPAGGSLDQQALRELHEQRHLVLGADGEIVMAHPFSAVPLGFSAMGHDTLWWGGCAWDSFALPHLLLDERDVLVATRCPGCDRPLAWGVGRDAPPVGQEVAHFLIPVSRMWDDVVHTCGQQRLFCGEPCVDAWLARTGNGRGYVLDLATLWRLARGWYAGRLEYGYRRREPSEAKDYFRSVGLSGPFWGL